MSFPWDMMPVRDASRRAFQEMDDCPAETDWSSPILIDKYRCEK